MLRYLLENEGQIVMNEELAYVAGAKDSGQRVRKLRTEEDYPIGTVVTGRPDPKMGAYALESADHHHLQRGPDSEG